MALRTMVAPFINSHVSRKRRAYAVKSGFTPPEGNIYLLLICWMIAGRQRRCQWILASRCISDQKIRLGSRDDDDCARAIRLDAGTLAGSCQPRCTLDISACTQAVGRKDCMKVVLDSELAFKPYIGSSASSLMRDVIG